MLLLPLYFAKRIVVSYDTVERYGGEDIEKQAVEVTINQAKLRIIQGDITKQDTDAIDILLVIRAMRVRMPHCELKWEMSDEQEE